MSIYIMYVVILLLTIMQFIIIKDKQKALKLTGILTISSSLLILILMFIAKIILTTFIKTINLSVIINYLSVKFIKICIVLFIVGIIEILTSKYILHKEKNKKTA